VRFVYFCVSLTGNGKGFHFVSKGFRFFSKVEAYSIVFKAVEEKQIATFKRFYSKSKRSSGVQTLLSQARMRAVRFDTYKRVRYSEILFPPGPIWQNLVIALRKAHPQKTSRGRTMVSIDFAAQMASVSVLFGLEGWMRVPTVVFGFDSGKFSGAARGPWFPSVFL